MILIVMMKNDFCYFGWRIIELVEFLYKGMFFLIYILFIDSKIVFWFFIIKIRL